MAYFPMATFFTKGRLTWFSHPVSCLPSEVVRFWFHVLPSREVEYAMPWDCRHEFHMRHVNAVPTGSASEPRKYRSLGMPVDVMFSCHRTKSNTVPVFLECSSSGRIGLAGYSVHSLCLRNVERSGFRSFQLRASVVTR